MRKENEYRAMQSKQEPIFTDTETEIAELKVMYHALNNRMNMQAVVITTLTKMLRERNEPLVKRAWKRFLSRNFKGK